MPCAPRKASAVALGDDRFLARLERKTGRVLKPAKRGPKPNAEEKDD